jgi:hypothetical protein
MRHKDSRHVRFSNRPIGVKRFQTTHHCSVDVSRGLVLFFGIGTKALPSWGSEDEVEQSMTRSLRPKLRLDGYPHHLRDATRIVSQRSAQIVFQSRKMLHAALLLLMFEAVHTNLVSPSA